MSENDDPQSESTGPDDLHNIYIKSQRNWYLEFTTPTPITEEMNEGQDLLTALFKQIIALYSKRAPDVPARQQPRFEMAYSGMPLIGYDGDTPIWHTKIHVTNVTPENEKAVDATFGVLETTLNNESEGDEGGSDGIEGRLPLFNVKSAFTLGILGRSAQGGSWGGGGPGGWPLPPSVSIPDKGMNDSTAPYYFNLPPNLEPLRANQGRDTIVSILDTCPTQADWEAAVERFPDNPLIASLRSLELKKKFRLIHSGDGALSAAQEESIAVAVADQDYHTQPVHDHGIFVAGIIHSIAPEATIWLYRAIDDSGVCLAGSVAAGLFESVSQQGKVPHPGMPPKPLIVNTSLTLMMPNEEKIASRQNPSKFTVEREWYTAMKSATVVAAAGNEATYKTRPATAAGTKGPVPPYPRFPAGFECTLGVSSLDKTGNRSNFANWADDFDLPPEFVIDPPPNPLPAETLVVDRRGIATMGGNALELSNIRMSDPADSVLGAYISKDFPVLAQSIGASTIYTAIKNTQGWARWSGTSFSTAIVSGILALIATDAYNNNRPTNRPALIAELLAICTKAAADTLPVPVPAQLSDTFIPLDALGALSAAPAAPHATEHILNVTQG